MGDKGDKRKSDKGESEKNKSGRGINIHIVQSGKKGSIESSQIIKRFRSGCIVFQNLCRFQNSIHFNNLGLKSIRVFLYCSKIFV